MSAQAGAMVIFPCRTCGGQIVEELINKVSEKAGISADQAKNAVNSVIEFIKTKMPGIGDQLKAECSQAGVLKAAESWIRSARRSGFDEKTARIEI